MVDLVKKFQKGNPPGIAADEQILAVTMVQPRASIVGAHGYSPEGGVIGNIVGDVVRHRMAGHALAGEGEIVGDAATWPPVESCVFAVTNRRLVVYDGKKGMKNLQGPVAEYPIERIAGISYEKKTLMNVIRISFTDGSVAAFDAGKGLRLDELVASVDRAKS